MRLAQIKELQYLHQQKISLTYSYFNQWTITTLRSQLIKYLFVIIVFLLQSGQINAAATLNTLQTVIYQLPYIQTERRAFTGGTLNNSGLSGTYNLTFQRVNLYSTQNKVIISMRAIDYAFDPADILINLSYNKDPNALYSTLFIFSLRAASTAVMTIYSQQINYLIIAQKLSDDYSVVIPPVANTFSFSQCDGSGGPVSCPYQWNFNTYLPSPNYRIFVMIHYYTYQRQNNLMYPYMYAYPTLLNSTHYSLTVDAKYIKVLGLSFWIVLIKQQLFDPTQRYQVMFSQVNSNISTGATNSTWNILFTHLVSDFNIFINLKGFQGFQISWFVDIDSPLSYNLLAQLNGTQTSLIIDSLAFYGYTTDCPTYSISFPCQACPNTCSKCNTYPSFFCEYCNTNFIPAGNMSCNCMPPFTEISNICDTFPSGCAAAQRLLSGIAQCTFCTPPKMVLNASYQCECVLGYQMNYTTGTCDEYCGDGLIFDAECDDGNTLTNDGCDSSCMIEYGFFADTSTSPPTLKSKLLLNYEVDEIIKDEFLNSAVIKLKKKIPFSLPYAVLKQNFAPLTAYLSLKIVTPSRQVNAVIQQIEVNSQNQILIKFDYDFTVESLIGKLRLNYEKTRYINDSQLLQFTLKGTNKALKFQSSLATFKTLGQTMLGGSILNIICLLAGLLSPKFIGLESILTLQLIYYSQLLIYKIQNWPPGFSFLKYLSISGGYNDIFQFTQYFLQDSVSIKMENLYIKKLIIQNFNINFVILLICSILLLIFTLFRNTKQRFVTIELKEKPTQKASNVQKSQVFNQKTQLEILKVRNKLNQAFYWVGSQVSFWLLLPLLCSFGSLLMIPNSSLQFFDPRNSNKWLIKFECVIVFFSLFLIFAIGFNFFIKFWLSLESFNKLLERPEEIAYKRILFIYLMIEGILIFFFNNFKISLLYCSTLVLFIHLVYLLLLLKINPYKQSLRIHSICLIFNQVVYLVFLVVINLINYLSDLNSLIILLLAYFITFCCGVSIVMTIFRLYYQLRYGPALQEEIQQERNKKKAEEKLRQQLLLKRKQQLLEEQAKLKITQKQRVRLKNDYLLENQINDEKKIELLNWLETRNWDQKAKQIYYFKRFTEKPLKWLQNNDQQKYVQKIQHIKEQRQTRVNRQKQTQYDPQFKETVQRLKQELKNMKVSKKIKRQYQL